MRAIITQENIDTFASSPLSTKEVPQGTDYAGGVDVGYTAPAKWWNGLWNKITAWFTACKTDRTSMLAELSNTLTSAQIAPSASDERQLSKAVDKMAFDTCTAYDNAEENGHKVNKPYVIGYTLYIPDTELL